MVSGYVVSKKKIDAVFANIALGYFGSFVISAWKNGFFEFASIFILKMSKVLLFNHMY